MFRKIIRKVKWKIFLSMTPNAKESPLFGMLVKAKRDREVAEEIARLKKKELAEYQKIHENLRRGQRPRR